MCLFVSQFASRFCIATHNAFSPLHFDCLPRLPSSISSVCKSQYRLLLSPASNAPSNFARKVKDVSSKPSASTTKAVSRAPNSLVPDLLPEKDCGTLHHLPLRYLAALDRELPISLPILFYPFHVCSYSHSWPCTSLSLLPAASRAPSPVLGPDEDSKKIDTCGIKFTNFPSCCLPPPPLEEF